MVRYGHTFFSQLIFWQQSSVIVAACECSVALFPTTRLSSKIIYANNNYDIQQKRLANVGEGVDGGDAVTKHQMEVGFSTKPDLTSVLLLDGKNHMTGDLDLRGNKIILPGEIDMDRKLITNLQTDQNQDLSAVNMVALKNNVGQKADKNYVDGEIAKQNDKFVKKNRGCFNWGFDFAS